jgi:hypothetical protein
VARFVSGIGGRLATALEYIQDAIKGADASGFGLEHTDEIRYGIRASLWTDGALKGFVEMLGGARPGEM